MTLDDFLERKLSALQLSPNSSLNVHVMIDTFKEGDFQDPSPQGSRSEFLKFRRLILVFQGRSANIEGNNSVPSTPTKKRPAITINSLTNNRQILVIGMSVCEYADRRNPEHIIRSYVQYVDTTGLYEPREEQSRVTKATVSAYIAYLQVEAKVSFVHLLAIAQPNYLFPGSEHLKGKHILDTYELVQWWLKTLTSAVETNSDTVIHAYSPDKYGTSEDVLAQDMFGDIPKRNGVSFHYGLPFNPNDLVNEAIPLFEDDPKWRLYEDLYRSKSNRESRAYEYAEEDGEEQEDSRKSTMKTDRTVKEFIEALTARPEFFKDPEATIIIVEFKVNEQQRCHQNLGTNSNAATKAKEMLFGLNFSDEIQAMASSAKISPWVRFMGSKGLIIKGEKKLIDNENASKRMLLNLTNYQKRINRPITD